MVNNSPIGLARFCTHRLYEIPGANDYYSGPDQRDTLRRAVGIVAWGSAHHPHAALQGLHHVLFRAGTFVQPSCRNTHSCRSIAHA